MSILPFRIPFATTALLTSLLAACGGGSDSTEATSTTPIDVTIQFAAVAGSANTPVACGSTIAGLGSTPTNATLTDLRFYVTDLALVNDKGVAVPVTIAKNDWQTTIGTDSVSLIDLENGTGTCAAEGTTGTNAVIKGTVPAGTYTQVKATIGVPEKLSHSDVMASAAPLDLMAMGWSWQAGRKFIKLEVNPTGGVITTTGSSPTWYLHLASTDCTGKNDGTDTCAKKNLAQISLPFDASKQQIALDVAAALAATNIKLDQGGATGCMSETSDLDCPAVFGKFGLDLASGTQAGTAQSVFRAIAK
jgi:uncharacterized repeat protein (TIGR04052 family)